MAFLERKSVVSYVCGCGRLRSLPRTYFCRHCYQLRCEFCVSHEIDSRYCSTCQEVLPITDAWMKGNKCSSCILCPMCSSNLTTRIFTAKTKSESGQSDPKATPTKSYYLCCLFCHWTSRDIGVPDATTSGSKWPELENPNAAVVNELVEYYKAVSINDRLEREKKLHGGSGRRAYSHISGLSSAIVRQKAGLAFRAGDTYQEPSKLKVTRAQAENVEDDLPADIYTAVPELLKVSNLRQRQCLPEAQPADIASLRYSRKILSGKRSYRCRTCEHNVIKPEYAPANTKFKIQLSAYYWVPEVRIKTVEPLRAGISSQLLLTIINPSQHMTTVTFRSFNDESSQVKWDSVLVPTIVLETEPNAVIDIPSADLPLPGRDDVAEFDEPTDVPSFNDDPNVVAFRKANRIVVKFSVRPDAELPVGSEVFAGLTLSHVHTVNTAIHTDKKQPNKIDHAFRLVLDLGKTVGS